MMKSTIATLALIGAAQALQRNPNEPHDLEFCPAKPNPPNCVEQTTEIYVNVDCEGKLKQSLTNEHYEKTDALMFGGRLGSALIPPYATLVFYDDVKLGGAAQDIFNDSNEPICVNLCDLPWTPGSAEAYYNYIYY